MIETFLCSLVLLAISWASYEQGRKSDPDSKDPMLLKTNFYMGSFAAGLIGVYLLIKTVLELLDV